MTSNDNKKRNLFGGCKEKKFYVDFFFDSLVDKQTKTLNAD